MDYIAQHCDWWTILRSIGIGGIILLFFAQHFDWWTFFCGILIGCCFARSRGRFEFQIKERGVKFFSVLLLILKRRFAMN